MTDLAEIALRLRDQAAWIAIETTAIDDTVEELGLELADVPHAVTDLRGLSDEALVELDRTRDSRVGSTSQVFLGSAADLSRLARNAPHTWSLVGPDCWTLDPEADRLDVPARLDELPEAGAGDVILCPFGPPFDRGHSGPGLAPCCLDPGLDVSLRHRLGSESALQRVNRKSRVHLGSSPADNDREIQGVRPGRLFSRIALRKVRDKQ